MKTLSFLLAALLLALFAGCDNNDSNVAADASGDGNDVQATACPPKDGAPPLDDVCSSEGQICGFGYEPIECGGIDLQCADGVWVEFAHTDPMTACFADVSDADATDSEDADTDVSDTCPTSIGGGEPCTTEDQICAYGYDPPECGGIDFQCVSLVWTERSHTDPGPDCFP